MTNTPQLRPYQQNAIDTIREKIAAGKKRILLVMPTGAGKTNLASEIVKLSTNKGKKSLFVAHKRKLVYQAHDRLAQFGINAGLIMPPHRLMNGHSTHVASIQTLIQREHPPADVVFLDECHHAASDSHTRVIKNYNDAIIIGLTATPFRTDGSPLMDIFEEIVAPVTMQELIDLGYLVKPRYFGAKIDLSLVGKKGHDYDKDQLFEVMDKKFLYDGVIEKFKEFGRGKTIVFCINIAHSIKTTSALVAAGYKAVHVDCNTSNEERKKIDSEFAAGKIQFLVNCGIYGEGYDCPDIDTVVLNMATKSLEKYMQIIGRGLRPTPGKTDCIVIDHGNNVRDHLPVEWEREVDCTKKRKNSSIEAEKEEQLKECTKCKSLVKIQAKICQHCGYMFSEKELELVDAKFEELNFDKIKPKIVIPAHLCKRWIEMNDDELEEYRALKGYRKGWVFHQKRLRIEEELKKNPLKSNHSICAMFNSDVSTVRTIRNKLGIKQLENKHPKTDIIEKFLLENPMTPNKVIARKYETYPAIVRNIRKKLGIAPIKCGKKGKLCLSN